MSEYKCSKCGSTEYEFVTDVPDVGRDQYLIECTGCGYTWWIDNPNSPEDEYLPEKDSD